MAFVFNPNEIDTSDDFVLMPEGVYMLQATKVERVFKDTGDFMVKMIFATMNEDFPGVFSQRFNMIHSNPQAQEIARRDFAKFCKASGIADEFPEGFEMDEASDEEMTDLFCHKPFDAKVGIEKSKNPKYSDSNQVAKYYPVGEGGNYGPLRNPQAGHAPAAPAGKPTAANDAPATGTATATTAGRAATNGAARTAGASGAGKANGAGSRPWNRPAA
ncbi:DUF669 domain-containing protein [Rhodoblastus acidophilus]|uniref:DUF669 domain-containing protein n=1 Tax=Rhodoblastus acidophilus TaxID=1074 RepID=A0A6N8DND7_RHOAC|nr:DUF669 domain-containing protein [Rhodoblastus acidophilus]MCW2275096.1 hypothetical protein [Rhodoblastus acidophilus]MTV31366.1 DUF669 domain-containing protein [Rhodoblastus acidophilus]